MLVAFADLSFTEAEMDFFLFGDVVMIASSSPLFDIDVDELSLLIDSLSFVSSGYSHPML
jgi:hypothetical protein